MVGTITMISMKRFVSTVHLSGAALPGAATKATIIQMAGYIRTTIAERVQMMLITMVVTTRHLLPLAPPMAIPPETQKNADKNIKGREKGKTAEKLQVRTIILNDISISPKKKTTPMMICKTPRIVAAVVL